MGDKERGVADEGRDLVRMTHELLQTVEGRACVAVLHRFIRPRLLQSANVDAVTACSRDPLREHRRQHEAITDDGNRARHGRLPRAAQRAASRWGVTPAARRDRSGTYARNAS